MYNLPIINNIQLLNLADNLVTAYKQSGVSIEKFSQLVEIPINVIEDAQNKIITDNFTVEHINNLAKHLNIAIKSLFSI